jgi:hypothetical protein
LAQIVQNHPELGEIIESWFIENSWLLSEQEQEAIRELLGWQS